MARKTKMKMKGKGKEREGKGKGSEATERSTRTEEALVRRKH